MFNPPHADSLSQKRQLVGCVFMKKWLRVFAVTLSLACMHQATFAICEKYADKVLAETIKPKPGMKLIQTPAEIRSGLERQIQSDAKLRGTAEAQRYVNQYINDYKFVRSTDPKKGLDTSLTQAHYLMRICAFGGDAESLLSGEASKPTTRASTEGDTQAQTLQQRSQQGQQSAQQAQQNAQQSQARADQQRQGKRKTNDPAAQAHECVVIDQAGSGNFGAFKNTCGYKVNFTTCNYKPRTIQGLQLVGRFRLRKTTVWTAHARQ
ncbi:MAG: hypothetical protein IPK34_11325 [Ramlibacter sp.]|nr:hypothetical protein [Ramlibacter sp.]